MKKNIFFILIAFALTSCIQDLSKKGVTQTLTYTGRVIEASNSPVADATVAATDGKTICATTKTDTDGKFSLNVEFEDVNDNYQLQITYRDFTTTTKMLGYGTGGRDLGDIVLYDKNDYYFAPQVTTSYLTNATTNSICVSGMVKDVSIYPTPISEYGICLYETTRPASTADTIRYYGDATDFTDTIKGLDLMNKQYVITTYATNEVGTSYGEQRIANRTCVEYMSLPTITSNDTIWYLIADKVATEYSTIGVVISPVRYGSYSDMSSWASKLIYATYDDWNIPSKHVMDIIVEQEPSLLTAEQYWIQGGEMLYKTESGDWKYIKEPNGEASLIIVRFDVQQHIE